MYLFYLSESNKIEEYLTGEGIQHLTGVKLKEMKYPLPPLAEQVEIVLILSDLLAKVDKLESQIQERETYTKQTMQSILKDAFEEA